MIIGEAPTFWVSGVVLFKEEKVKKISPGQSGNLGRHQVGGVGQSPSKKKVSLRKNAARDQGQRATQPFQLATVSSAVPQRAVGNAMFY